MWGGGIYGPKWISTTYTMMTLKRIGLAPGNEQARLGCKQLLESGRYPDGGINFFASQDLSEACVTGMVLSILSHFRYQDAYLDGIADHLLERQMPDGGWNCDDHKGATHSSFHTTMSVLEVMSKDVIVAGPDESVEALMAIMTENRIRHIPIINQGRLAGLVSIGDVVKAQLTVYKVQISYLKDYIEGKYPA